MVNISHDLDEFCMNMREHAKTNDMLEPVSYSVVSSSILLSALVKIWDVG